MIYAWLTGLLFINAFWLMLVFFALPGNWLIIISTGLFAWWRWEDGIFSIYTLVAITVLAIIGEIVEFFAGAGGAKKAGAGWFGAIAAIFGAIAGAVLGTVFIPIPILGTLLGACIGAGGGTMLVELMSGRQMHQSIRSGLGAGTGVFLGTVGKFMIGAMIWLIVAIAAFVG